MCRSLTLFAASSVVRSCACVCVCVHFSPLPHTPGHSFLVVCLSVSYAAETEDSAEQDIGNRAQAARAVGWTSFAITCVFILIVFFLRNRIALAIQVVVAASCAVNQMKGTTRISLSGSV